MRVRIHNSTTFISLCCAVFLVAAAFMFSFVGKNTLAASQGGRLITVHDRGEEVTFLTQKTNLKEAFLEQGISINEKDTVEPAIDEELIAPDYKVNIYRARPVTVIDGMTRTKVVTAYQSPQRIAEDAGITLYPEDSTVLSLPEDLIKDGAGLQLVIQRATPISVILYGKETELRTQAKTVEGVLEEKGIKLASNDRISVSKTTPVQAGMSFRLWREGKQTITATEDIPFAVEQIKDADRSVGYSQVQKPGSNGSKSVTYEIEIQDGQEVSRRVIASVTITEPITQVEVVGSKPVSLPYTGGGTKTDWLAASNIPEEDWGYADYLVSRESSWNPNAVNKSSGACGLAQALPCSKVPGNPYDPVNSLNWMNGYVSRYGGWKGAYDFWVVNHWY